MAITRAEKRLFLLDSEGYNQNGKEKYPSRFLWEIGEDNYIRIGNISKELQDSARRYAAQMFEEKPESELKKTGDQVTHPAFGTGTILGYGKNKSSYIIRFDKLQSEREISVDFFNRKRDSSVIEMLKKSGEAAASAPAPAPETKSVELKNIPVSVPQQVKVKPIPIPIPVTAKTPDEEKQAPVQLPPQKPVEVKVPELKKTEQVTAERKPEGYEKVEETKVPEYKSVPGGPSQQPQNNSQPEQPEPIPPKMNTSGTNLWERDDVPKTGWVCTGVTDLGAPVGICQMCGHQIIRYVHHMYHPEFGELDVGCVCTGRMEGDVDRAKRREQDFKNKQARKENFHNRKWKTSKNNNSFIKIKDHLIVLYYNKNYNNWKYSIDNVFCKEVFATKEEAVDAAFEALEDKLSKK